MLSFLASVEDTSRCGQAAFLAPPLAPLVVPSPRLSQCLSQRGQLCSWKPLLGGASRPCPLSLGSGRFPGARCPSWVLLGQVTVSCVVRSPWGPF